MSVKHFFQNRTVELVLGMALPGLFYGIVWPNTFYRPSLEERSAAGAAWRAKGIDVAVVWPRSRELSFVSGVQLAWEEVDRGSSALAGRIRLRIFDQDNVTNGREIAAKVAGDSRLVAVLGHETSASATAASVVYERHGVLFITPKATDPELTRHGFDYLFRLTPDDGAIAGALVHYAGKMGFKRIGVLYARTGQGESFSSHFVGEASDAGLEVPFERSYLARDEAESEDFRSLAADVRQEDFDALVIADYLPRAAELVRDLVRMGVTQPILGCDKLDSRELWEVAGPAANNVYVASAVDPNADAQQFQTFRKRYREHFGVDPGYGASQGYAAFHLLASAILLSQTADPLTVSTTIRCTKPWKGLFGDVSFTNEGDIQGRTISIKRMQDGVFATVHF